MSEQGAAPPAGAQTPAQAATTTESPATPPQAAQAAEPTELKDLPAWAQKLVRDLRRESGEYRTKLQALEDRDKSELQKAQERTKELESGLTAAQQALRQERGMRAAAAAAKAANAIDPDAVAELAIRRLEWDDDGRPANLPAAIAELKKSFPRLFGTGGGSGDGGAGGATDAPGGGMNALIRRAAGIRT